MEKNMAILPHGDFPLMGKLFKAGPQSMLKLW